MQNDCQVTTAELDQVVPSRHIAYRHDHARMATLGINGCVTIFAPGDSEQQWEFLCQMQLEECTPVQVHMLRSHKACPMSSLAKHLMRILHASSPDGLRAK